MKRVERHPASTRRAPPRLSWLTRSLRLLRHVRERTEAAREQACAADAFPCAKETRGKEKCWARKNIASVRLDDSVACRLVVSVRIRRGGEWRSCAQRSQKMSVAVVCSLLVNLVSFRAHGGPIHITFDRYRNLPLFKLWLLGACRDLACVKIPAITNVRVKSYRCERNAVPK